MKNIKITTDAQSGPGLVRAPELQRAQGELDDKLTPERVHLLEAIRAGDLATIRASTKMSWDFIYPPAQVRSATSTDE